MRTTLTLEDDVAIQLEGLRKARDVSLKELVNEALRRGLQEMARPRPRKPFRTKALDLGEPLVDVSNVAEALAIAEGEAYK
jgi:hypothetical protein